MKDVAKSQHHPIGARFGIWGAASAMALLSACSATRPVGGGPGTVTYDVPGSMPVTRTTGVGPRTGGGALGPPSNLEPQASRGGSQTGAAFASGPPQSGAYTGVMTIMQDPGGRCTSRVPLTGWQVNGNQVTFGAFNGTIGSDGSLTMQSGPSYISGRFTGSHFQGRFYRPGPFCNYAMSLEPA